MIFILRASPYFSREVLCVCAVTTLLCAACEEPPDPRRTNFRVERGNVVAQYDDKTGRMKRLEVDTNKNGKMDTWTYMDGTRIDRIEIDRDEDDKIDRWEYYTDNKMVRVGTSTRGDGVVDEWAFQGPNGVVSRVETDVDRDGRIDKWEHFDPPAYPGAPPTLREVGLDPDPSGQPTRRLLYNARGEFERVDRKGAAVPR
jgi:hypothetical protein